MNRYFKSFLLFIFIAGCIEPYDFVIEDVRPGIVIVTSGDIGLGNFAPVRENAHGSPVLELSWLGTGQGNE